MMCLFPLNKLESSSITIEFGINTCFITEYKCTNVQIQCTKKSTNVNKIDPKIK